MMALSFGRQSMPLNSRKQTAKAPCLYLPLRFNCLTCHTGISRIKCVCLGNEWSPFDSIFDAVNRVVVAYSGESKYTNIINNPRNCLGATMFRFGYQLYRNEDIPMGFE